jgi:hypothetical protein
LVTDTLRSDDAAHRTVLPTVHQKNHVYANNRAGVSHQLTRQRERAMWGFTSPTPRATIPDASRPHTKPLSSGPPSDAGGELSSVTYSGMPSVAGYRMCMRCSCKAAPLCPHIVKLTTPVGTMQEQTVSL